MLEKFILYKAWNPLIITCLPTEIIIKRQMPISKTEDSRMPSSDTVSKEIEMITETNNHLNLLSLNASFMFVYFRFITII